MQTNQQKTPQQKKQINTKYNTGHTFNMKIALSIPDELFKAADQYAKSLGVSRSQLYAKAVAQFLEQHPADHITKQLNNIYSTESVNLDETLSTIKFRSIEEEEW